MFSIFVSIRKTNTYMNSYELDALYLYISNCYFNLQSTNIEVLYSHEYTPYFIEVIKLLMHTNKICFM